MSIRNRKFVYEYEKWSPEIYEDLKKIKCMYHIISIENNYLYGFIYFKEAKTVSAVQKKMKYKKIFYTDKNPLEIRNELMKKKQYWETGVVPKQIRDTSTNMNNICSFIMKHHEHLIQTVINDKTIVMERNIKLQEENDSLKKSLLENVSIQNTITNAMTNAMTNSMNNSNNSTDNSKNKKITNINVFLNTECKDAITLKDFINELVIEDEDLMCLKDHGYIESVSRLLNKALVNYDLYKRPIHCSDVKREVMHVKDQEGWKKETPTGESANLDKAFSRLSQLQCKKMVNYYQDVEEPNMDEKASIMCRIAESSNEENCKKKIIKKIIENIKL
jgi:hypothetical protein